MKDNIFMAYVLFQDGGPCAGEATVEADVFSSCGAAESWIDELLSEKIEEVGPMDREDLREAYLDASEAGTVPSATWDVLERKVRRG